MPIDNGFSVSASQPLDSAGGCALRRSSSRTGRNDFPPQPCASHSVLPLQAREASPVTGHPWFVLRTTMRREGEVRDALDQHGFGTFLPMVVEERIKRRFRFGRWHEERRRKPVIAFPGYLFVAFDPAAALWRSIAGLSDDARGLICRVPEHPTPVPAAAMRVLFELGHDRPMVDDPIPALIKVGATVRVEDGPFTSFTGVCVASDKRRIQVMLSMFGRQTPADFRPDQVTPL